ncbi:cupin domain-containing protein [Acidobacteria bacterium AH-259-G07]|nr:cupin domain-containing protein [Acidobacteria bacterium AH-259-G07]
MRKATDFMMNRVSSRGGFVWHYSEDFSRQWGEVPARKSQVWVQPPGSTPSVGMMLLEAYEVRGDAQYLKYADKVAGALIWGQLPSGGWHYFIDFDAAGVQKWYREVASQCRGWEEFYHYNGNATYDDDTTASATRLLLRLYARTLDPKYRPSLLKALDFILESQYPNGAWPQRYPLRYDFPHDGHADYTSFYTFNDGVISNNIELLLEAYEKLGNEEYRKAAYRGMDFYILSQLPSPQAGWAQQYDMDLRPASARSYEPAALNTYQTMRNIKDLENFYLITRDRRYLEPIPKALQWLEASVINTDRSRNFTHAIYYEIETNKPLYPHHEHRRNSEGKLQIVRFWVDGQYTDERPYSALPQVDLQALRREFEHVSALTPEEAAAEYGRRKKADPTVSTTAEEVKEILSSLDSRGAWVTDIEFLDTLDYVDNPRTRFRGIDTRTYVSNMRKLVAYLRAREDQALKSEGPQARLTFIDLAEIPINELLPGVRTRTPYGENLMFSYVEMDAGTEVPTHSHPHEQGGILLEGRIEMTIGLQTRVLEPGVLYLIPPNVPHAVLTVGGPAKILDVFSPIREDYAKLVNEYIKQEDR